LRLKKYVNKFAVAQALKVLTPTHFVVDPEPLVCDREVRLEPDEQDVSGGGVLGREVAAAEPSVQVRVANVALADLEEVVAGKGKRVCKNTCKFDL
jgi:hypothetical protein